MAITKIINIGFSKKGNITRHLANALEYIQNGEKTESGILVGSINCLPDTALEQMLETKRFFGKEGGRQGYHLIISLVPGEGSPEIAYEIIQKFAEKFLGDAYEGVYAVHADKEHTHAHLIFNSVNMNTGQKYNYKKGDWKHKIQPITNELTEEYGLELMPAEYSVNQTNMSRDQWEKEHDLGDFIKGDVYYCASLASSYEHFKYLMEMLGYQLKEGKHLAVKTPDMKRFRRIDTLDEFLTKENLETLIKYGDTRINPKIHTTDPRYIKRSSISQFQNRFYQKMYCLRVVEKHRFTAKAAHYYKDILKMQRLQQEYLMICNENINCSADLVNYWDGLKQKIDDISQTQEELHKEHYIRKRACKDSEDNVQLIRWEVDYYQECDELKAQKKQVKEKLKLVEGCMKETMVPALIDYCEKNIDNMYDVEVPEYKGNAMEKEQADLEETYEKVLVDEAVLVEAKDGIKHEVDVSDIEADKEGDVIDEVIHATDIFVMSEVDTTLSVTEDEMIRSIASEVIVTALPESYEEYMLLSVEEKAVRYQFDERDDIGSVYHIVAGYLATITTEKFEFDDIYEESKVVWQASVDIRTKVSVEMVVDKVLARMKDCGIDREMYLCMSGGEKAQVFELGNMDFSLACKVHLAVMKELGIELQGVEQYEEFQKVYDASIRMDDNKEKGKMGIRR